MNFSFKFARIRKIGQIETLIYGNTKIEDIGFCIYLVKCEIIETEAVDDVPQVIKGQLFCQGKLLDTATQAMCLCRLGCYKMSIFKSVG